MAGLSSQISDQDSAYFPKAIIFDKYTKLGTKPPQLFESSSSLVSIKSSYKSTIDSKSDLKSHLKSDSKKDIVIKKHIYPYNYNPRLVSTISDDIWSIIRAFRNGFIYGIKIRLPHSFVMTLLFSRTELRSMSFCFFFFFLSVSSF